LKKKKEEEKNNNDDLAIALAGFFYTIIVPLHSSIELFKVIYLIDDYKS